MPCAPPWGDVTGTLLALRRSVAATLDLLLPRACVACESPVDAGEADVVCGRCWTRLVALPHPRCDRCGHPRPPTSCRWCELLPPFVRAVRSVCWYPAGTAAAIVHALKYDGWTAVADGMASRIARLTWPVDVLEERALIVPVPLAPARERERGYNQSALIAAALARRWSVPSDPTVLRRTRRTESQTRLTPEQRLRNVFGAFRAVDAARSTLRGAHVILVDDVVTTAATLNACATALCAAGARIVSYATFGRAPAIGDR